MTVTVTCGDCRVELAFPRDPAREVPCLDCGAPIGSPCRKPSGHRMWRNVVHASRDVAALEAGAYVQHRQDGRCTVTHEQAVARAHRRLRKPTVGRRTGT